VYNCSSGQSVNRRRSTDKTSPPEGLKRSERLRDRRVHYADMVQGIHPRHSAVDGTETEPKTGETGRQQNSHHSSVKADGGLPRQESSTRLGHRTPSTDRSARSEAAPVESLHCAPSANYRRKSMELRSSTDKQIDEVAAKQAASPTNSLVSAPPGGRRRRSSGSHQIRQEEIPHGTVTSGTGMVKSGGETVLAKPAQLPSRRHRGSVRHRRHVAGRRRSRLVPLSTNTDPPVQTNSSTEVSFSDCSQLSTAAAIDKETVCSFVDTSVSNVMGDSSCKMLKMDSEVVENGTGCCSSGDGAVRTSLKTPVSNVIDVSAVFGESGRLKHDTPLENIIPVMHVDFSRRVGRQHHGQDGVVLLDHYLSVDAACVLCSSCSQLMSISEFLCHMHNTSRIGVGSVRRLGPVGVAGPAWHKFQRRRAKFGLGACSVDPPAVGQATESPGTDSSSGSADSGDIPDVSVENTPSTVLAVDDVGKTEIAENLPPASVGSHDTSGIEVVKKPVDVQDTTVYNDTGTEKCPPPVPAVEGEKSISDDDRVTLLQPLEDVVAAASHSAAVKTSDVPEPRLTRSRRTSVGPAETSPGPLPVPGVEGGKSVSDDDRVALLQPPEDVAAASHSVAVKTSDVSEPRLTRSRRTSIGPAETSPGMSLRRQSAAVETPAAAASRHSGRSCKRVRPNLATPASTHRGSSGEGISSRVELRPRPPPRATAPK